MLILKKNVSFELKFILRIYNFHYFVVVVLFLGIGLGACSSKEIGPNYSYPTGSQQRVLELCALVYLFLIISTFHLHVELNLEGLGLLPGDFGQHLRMVKLIKYQ